jgi:excisionase family DNA binding protein
MNPDVQSIPNPAAAPQDGELYWEHFVDAQKAAEFLGIDLRTVRRLAEARGIPAHRWNDGEIAADWRFLLSELEDWLRQAIATSQRLEFSCGEFDAEDCTERRWTF